MGKQLKTNQPQSNYVKPMTRKELRKQARKDKKARKNEYFRNKRKIPLVKSLADQMNNENKNIINSNSTESKPGNVVNNGKGNSKTFNVLTKPDLSLFDERRKLREQEIKKIAKLGRDIIKQRKRSLLEANVEEDKEIKKLEKLLHLNKRKTKTMPKSFIDDGLDYVLEVCESSKLLDPTFAELDLEGSESESESQDDVDLVTGKEKKRKVPQEIENKISKTSNKKSIQKCNSDDDNNTIQNKRKMTNKYLSDEEEGDDFNQESEEEEVSDTSENEDNDNQESNEETTDAEDQSDSCINEELPNESKDTSNSGLTKNQKKDGVREDIYGRLRDKEGNVIQEKGKYVPPHLRAQVGQNAEKSKELARLKKQLKGLINRLAESNIHSIAKQIDGLYQRNSRNDMNDTLLSLISEALVTPALSPDRLVMEHALFIAALHANIGMEIGAHFLENFVLKFHSMYREGQEVQNKQLDNILLIISYLYNFKVVHSVLVYNLLDLLADKFLEKEVELILLVLRSVGFGLRKDDPLALKDLVLRLQKKASEATELKDNTRVRFMLDVLFAVKNNNVSKLPQYDPTLSEHLKKLLKTLVHKGKYVTELKITLDDFLHVEERGRWWIVGSAWTGAAPQALAPAVKETTQFSQKVLDLARKQRMNTDNRRNIFCIIMSAEDYLDASVKLLRLGLKGQQDQEIFHIMVHCLLMEKDYNPYYSILATHFCKIDRKHQMTLKYLLWDKFKEVSSMTKIQITNLAHFIAHLCLEKALPISVLKVIKYSEMDKPRVCLLRKILLAIMLTESDEEEWVAVFKRVSQPQGLRLFRESLRLFMHHFVLQNIDKKMPERASIIKKRVKLAEAALSCVDVTTFY